jgi:hypothetical protein
MRSSEVSCFLKRDGFDEFADLPSQGRGEIFGV